MTSRLLRWASAIMIFIGAGHLVLSFLLSGEHVGRWISHGLWAAVPLLGGSPENAAAFWGGLGSFSVPQILLGCLIWYLAGRGVTVPAGIGWGFAAWCVVGGLLLVPSPFFVGVIPGALIVLAARRG
ncbi:DUF6463 family protein [Allokutzneria albata]|uniref:Uncharacterized protein n=1 Tax=Allokutzneria albata TaxID=211114 RepID=A0A1G9SZ81_ALLAB|nr:DUF6463 family protein [Allokutzneria albata]SDM40702.1 hypothetical protein SAMN04489726_1464 [Allokutzneria albata]